MDTPAPSNDPAEPAPAASSPFEDARRHFARAVALLPGFKQGLIDFLSLPKRTVSVCFPVEMDAAAARLFAEAGARIVVGMPETLTITNEAPLACECGVLIPAAPGGQIHAHNAARVVARLVAEAANGPVTPEGDDLLSARGVAVLPDILANAGGVTASYFEWVQNYENERWDREEVNRKPRTRMHRAADAVAARHRSLSEASAAPGAPAPTLRTAALVVATERLARVTLQRGIWP